ncbi:MAG: peptidoglycan DD-metalloendopeptidase family protein [Actinomycetaceae bacterium]|nr:peptidoglycan DD-metalloendopeptidase family protein [Actinomycetaceae bacterium]
MARNSHHSYGRGRGRLFPALAAFAFAAGILTPVAYADEHDDVADNQQKAADRIAQLKSDLQGIDATLAQVYIDLDSLNQRIPTAESELTAAENKRDAAIREHGVAVEQLNASKAEQTRLSEDIVEAEKQQKEAEGAIAGLAREMYRSGRPSPLVLAMTAEGSQEISDRAAVAETMARSQDAVLGNALNVQASQRTRLSRQDAVTSRITELEDKARTAKEASEAAAKEAENKVVELNTLKKQAAEKAKEWDKKKTEATAQLDKWEAEHQAATKRLAEIDEENRKKNVVMPNAPTAAGNSGGFAFPLPHRAPLTSPFGMRFHPVLGYERMHYGTDFGADCGVPVLSIAPGVVTGVTFEEAGGNVVYVNHGMVNGVSLSSAYVHLQSVSVSEGQTLGAGQQVGDVGTTGYSTGCHLHISVMENGADVDPMGYIQ